LKTLEEQNVLPDTAGDFLARHFIPRDLVCHLEHNSVAIERCAGFRRGNRGKLIRSNILCCSNSGLCSTFVRKVDDFPKVGLGEILKSTKLSIFIVINRLIPYPIFDIF
jgi:hypothetical protein